jgi:hypothetical protein
MQAMEFKTPMMLLFVCNGTDQSSIATDLHHMLDIAYKDIDKEGMMPEQYENRDLPKFVLRLNVPCLPKKKSAKDNKAYDHLQEHGKKAFHLEVAKSDQEIFTFLANHAHRMGLDAKYFGKFAKLTVTLGKDAPLSNCSRLWRCIQGHLNYHLSSTLVAINRIEDLDASEIVCNPTTGMKVDRVLLCDMLYKIKLLNNSPLFLQLSQCPLGEVNAVISNMAKAKNMAKQINVQVAAWCHYYWRETNKGGERFFKKLAERAFNAHLNHKVSECIWDAAAHVVTSPRSLSEMSAVYKVESLDWVKDIVHAEHNPTKKHVDPTAVFNFKEDFSVGTIRGKNNAIHAATTGKGATTAIELSDNNNVGILMSKMQDDTDALVEQEQCRSTRSAGDRVATGSRPSAIGPTADATPAGATGLGPVAAEGSQIPLHTGTNGSTVGGPGGQ